jgi:CheY-like chemotaxis protein
VALLVEGLPEAALSAQKILRAPSTAGLVTDAASEPMRILVVDDNRVNLKVAEKQLQRLGYRVELASGGRSAIEALSRTRYPIMLLDCEMPDMDGYETTAEIRKSENGSLRTIIIAMTAHALEGARARCLAAGMDEYVAKPVTLQALIAVLGRCVLLMKDEMVGTPNEARTEAP